MIDEKEAIYLNMNERIKKIRKTLNLTQREFAERIGLKQNSIALIESGRNTSDQTIFAICREFNINEKWIRTGEGEMFNPTSNSALDALAQEYNLSPSLYRLLEKFINLKPEVQEMVLRYVKEIIATFQFDDSNDEPDVPSVQTAPAQDFENLSIDEKVEIYRQELEREKKVEGKSEVS